MCGLARLAFPTLLSGLIVAGLTGSSALGWLAAAVVAGTLYLLNRRRPAGACGLSRASARPFEGLVLGERDHVDALVVKEPTVPGPEDVAVHNREP